MNAPQENARDAIRGLLVLMLTLAPAPAAAQNLGLLGVESAARGIVAPGAPAVPATALLRDAWGWQESAHAVVYATMDVRALAAVVGEQLAADALRSVLGIERAEDVVRVSRVASRSCFATLKNPDTFAIVDTSIPAGELARRAAARTGAALDSWEDGGRTYYSLALSPTHAMTAAALGTGRVQVAYHAVDGEVSLLAAETPMNGGHAAALDPSALLSLRVTNPRLLPDVTGAGIVKDAVRNGLKSSLVGSVARIDARVDRLGGDQLMLRMTVVPVAGTDAADLARRYNALRGTAGMVSSAARTYIDRVVVSAQGGAVSVELTASAAEFRPLLMQLARGEMPWS